MARIRHIPFLMAAVVTLLVVFAPTTSTQGQSNSDPQTDSPSTPRTDFDDGRFPPTRARTAAMSVTQAAVLGVVEGLTEYLPVSSTGHLVLTQRAMGLGADGERSKAAADAFAICIQAGAILAVLGLYWRHVLRMLRGLLGRDPFGLRLAINVIVGVVPAVVIGLALEKNIKRWLFGGGTYGLWPVVVAWIAGGAAILIVSRRRKTRGGPPAVGLALEELTWRRAFLVGVMQCVAMWPGVSRSLVTIVGGSLVGLRLPAAVEFSFLLGVVTLGGATAKDSVAYGPLMFELYGPLPLVVGAAAAALSAAVAVRWMVAYLNRHGLEVFGYYRIAVGALVGALILANVL